MDRPRIGFLTKDAGMRTTLEAFLDYVRRSGLIEPALLDEHVGQFRDDAADPQSARAEDLAGHLVAAGLLTPWQSEKLLDGRHKGFFLSKYRILDHISAGDGGAVYLAEHVLMRRRVALKVFPPRLRDDPEERGRLHRDVEAAARIDHQNLVRVYDIDQEGGIHYLVMEYVEGRSLQRVVQEDGPPEAPVAAGLIAWAALGLDHAHTAGLIHGNVKPSKLMVDRRWTVKVLDLGVAPPVREPATSSYDPFEGDFADAVNYTAPEQTVAGRQVDARTDVYSLGCCLHFLLCGRPPFPEGTAAQRLEMHRSRRPPSIRAVRPDVPDDLVQICSRMMAKKPEDRFQSMGEVAEELANFVRTQDDAAKAEDDELMQSMLPASAETTAVRSRIVRRDGRGVPELTSSIREALDAERLVFCPSAESLELEEELLQSESEACRAIGRGFNHLVVLDARKGCDQSRGFVLTDFYAHTFRRLVDVFELNVSGAYHEADITQFLRDEEGVLLCLLCVDVVPGPERASLRSLAQERHHVLVTFRSAATGVEGESATGAEGSSRATWKRGILVDEATIMKSLSDSCGRELDQTPKAPTRNDS